MNFNDMSHSQVAAELRRRERQFRRNAEGFDDTPAQKGAKDHWNGEAELLRVAAARLDVLQERVGS